MSHPFIAKEYESVYASVEDDIDLKRLPMYRSLKAFLPLNNGSNLLKFAKEQFPKESEIVLRNFTEHVALKEAKRVNALTQRAIYFTSGLLVQFPSISHKSIIEIGGAFGCLARVILLTDGTIKKYTMVDHPKLINLARQYLSGFKAARLIPVFDLEKAVIEKHDLFISSLCLTETTKEYVTWLIANIFPKCDNFFIVDNFEAHLGIAEDIRKYLEENTIFEMYPFDLYKGQKVYVGKKK